MVMTQGRCGVSEKIEILIKGVPRVSFWVSQQSFGSASLSRCFEKNFDLIFRCCELENSAFL